METKKDTKLDFIYVNIHKDDIIVETKDALLLLLNANTKVWINQKDKYAFTSKFTNIVSISLVKNWKYNLFNLENEKIKEVNGEELAKLF